MYKTKKTKKSGSIMSGIGKGIMEVLEALAEIAEVILEGLDTQ